MSHIAHSVVRLLLDNSATSRVQKVYFRSKIWAELYTAPTVSLFCPASRAEKLRLRQTITPDFHCLVGKQTRVHHNLTAEVC